MPSQNKYENNSLIFFHTSLVYWPYYCIICNLWNDVEPYQRHDSLFIFFFFQWPFSFFFFDAMIWGLKLCLPLFFLIVILGAIFGQFLFQRTRGKILNIGRDQDYGNSILIIIVTFSVTYRWYNNKFSCTSWVCPSLYNVSPLGSSQYWQYFVSFVI